MSQWVEVRHLHLVEGVPKKEIARRLKLDVKTVRRAIGRPTPPVRVSPPRPSTLAPWSSGIGCATISLENCSPSSILLSTDREQLTRCPGTRATAPC